MCANVDETATKPRTHIQIIMEHSPESRIQSRKKIFGQMKNEISAWNHIVERFAWFIHSFITTPKVNGPESISLVGKKWSAEASSGNWLPFKLFLSSPISQASSPPTIIQPSVSWLSPKHRRSELGCKAMNHVSRANKELPRCRRRSASPHQIYLIKTPIN